MHADSQQQVLPQDIQSALQVYQKSKEQQWNFVKNHNDIALYQQTNTKTIQFKALTTFNLNFLDIQKLLSVQGEPFIQLHQKSNRMIADQSLQIYQSMSCFKDKKQFNNINDIYSRYELLRPNHFMIIKQSLKPTNYPKCLKNYNQKKSVVINKVLDLIHVIYDKENINQCLVQQIIIFQRNDNEQLFIKYIKELLINLSIINYESQDILQKIQDKNDESKNLQKQVSQKNVDSSATQQVVISQKNFSPQKSSQSTSSTSQNIYLVPNDRLDYIDEQYDKEHGAFKYAETHQRIKDLSQEELSVLEDFRVQMKSYQLNDNTLIRFLQARNFKINDAESLFLKTLEWRKENDLNSFKMQDYPCFIEQDLHEIIGIDRFGHPILYTKCCNSDPNKMKEEKFSLQNYMKFHRGFLEDGCRMMKGDVDSYMVIMDCYNLSYKNFSLSVMKNQFQEVFNYYPERQYKNYVINSDFLTRTLYKILKPFLPDRTISKIRFVGQNFDEIREVFLTEMDISVIPKRYGGGNMKVQ